MLERHPHILRQNQSVLIIIDMQEKFESAIPDFTGIETSIVTLIKGCKVLNIPIYYTEQYPKGLGRTTPPIVNQLEGVRPIEKMRFTAVDESIVKSLQEKKITQIVLAGIETHVCVLQSALDYFHLGFQVHVARDATGSRLDKNRDVALGRMNQKGIDITVVESALFELLEISGTEEFRTISKLLK